MEGYSRCQNCARQWRNNRLKPIIALAERVAPGEPCPSGECPSCGALCQLLVPPDSRQLVIISISGGVAEVQECPPGVDVEIRDHDDCASSGELCIDCQQGALPE